MWVERCEGWGVEVPGGEEVGCVEVLHEEGCEVEEGVDGEEAEDPGEEEGAEGGVVDWGDGADAPVPSEATHGEDEGEDPGETEGEGVCWVGLLYVVALLCKV